MTETKLLNKYQNLMASMPDVEVLSERNVIENRNPSYEVEFIVVKGVPQTERAQTKTAWEAVLKTGGQIPPEAVAHGLNKGVYEVPVLRYKLNNQQKFTEIAQNLIFDSKQSDRVLAAYYVATKDESRKLLKDAMGPISILEDPSNTAEAADQYVRSLQRTQTAIAEVIEESQEEDEGRVIKFTAIFMEEDEVEPKKLEENPKVMASSSGNLDDAISSFIESSKK